MNNIVVTVLCTALLLVVLVPRSNGQDEPGAIAIPQSSRWQGLWVAEGHFGPWLRGPVSVHRVRQTWLARVQGETVDVERQEQTDGSVRWAFAFFDQGRFVGQQATPDGTIVGHWLQPPGRVFNYPFATPVRLTPVGSDTFVGEVRPVAQQVSLNIPLSAERTDATDGATRYRTFLRNPERNLGVYFRIESATAIGDELRFANGDGETLAIGRSTAAGERFTLLFPRFDTIFEFTRRSRQDAPGFYPRRWPSTPTSLPRPVETNDGWLTATPAQSGLDTRPLVDLIGELVAFEPTALRQPYIHALLLAHRGRLVVEEYFHGYHRQMTHDSRSAGKSLTSALLGIALRERALASVDQPVYALFGGVAAYANPDPRKARMTVRHLVTMTSGFDCDDNRYDTPGNEDRMQSQTEQPDWYRYTLDLPMVREPGTAGVYCTAGIHLIGQVLRERTATSLPQYFEHAFARPMDIDYYQMNLSPTYRGYMGGGIRLRPRDFLKLGQLYLDGGVWRGRRIVSEEWVRTSTAAHASVNETDDYGFAWWRKTYQAGDRRVETYHASGNGGQLLFVVPALNLVALIQAGNYGDGRTRNKFRDRLMQEAILPAAPDGR